MSSTDMDETTEGTEIAAEPLPPPAAIQYFMDQNFLNVHQVEAAGGGDNMNVSDPACQNLMSEHQASESSGGSFDQIYGEPRMTMAFPTHLPVNGDNHEPRSENSTNDDHVEQVNSSPSSIFGQNFKFLADAIALNVEEDRPKIRRVPSIMDRNEKDFYQPKMVSIGPYHHGRLSNCEESEKLKHKLAALFIQEHHLSTDDLFSKIKGEIEDLRECYKKDELDYWSEEWLNDDKLTLMFLVDGCAVLHYIHCAMNAKLEKVRGLKIKVDCLMFMEHDLFLLENQLPYRVLKLLMSCLDDNGNKIRESIEKLIFTKIKAPRENQQNRKQQQDQKPIHLLDLLRTRLLQSNSEDQVSRLTVQQIIKNVVEFISNPFETFQNLMEYIAKTLESSSLPTKDKLSFRSVEELQAAGIRFRPSSTGRLTDISFNLGTLKLPPILVDDSTASKFLNLIAYEMCPDFDNKFEVSSYIVFLDALIDRAQDVKALRDSQILHNALGSDKEVAKLFNIIGTNLVQNQEIYSKVKIDIQKRYDNKWMTWIAQFIDRHFQSPWSVLAFIAAIIILASTVAQTVYTVLGYYHQ